MTSTVKIVNAQYQPEQLGWAVECSIDSDSGSRSGVEFVSDAALQGDEPTPELLGKLILSSYGLS